MKRPYILSLLILVVSSFSCKKFIQQQEEAAVMSIITNGNWYVYQYLQNSGDSTANFSGYLFKFDANGVVTGTRSGVSYKGSWAADVNARTITSAFPSAPSPLPLLNGVWKIRDSGTDFVLANYTDTVNHLSDTLRLQKQ
jgi:hypothetical protein